MTEAKLGERVLLVPQGCADLTNPHIPDNAIGHSPYAVRAHGVRASDPTRRVTKLRPSWEVYTSTLVRKGYGVMVVRDGKLQIGPSDWDTGD